MARVPGTRNMILIGVRDGGLDLAALAARLRESDTRVPGVWERLGWMVDEALFAPVAPLARKPLRDADSPVEALAHASWRASS
jgi:hypothetical protein